MMFSGLDMACRQGTRHTGAVDDPVPARDGTRLGGPGQSPEGHLSQAGCQRSSDTGRRVAD